jgi:hypothetical protein
MVFEWCMALCTLSISYIYQLTKKDNNKKKRREGEQLSKGKQFRDKKRDQYTYTQAIEREIE